MMRLSLTGVLERHPGLRIITHHLGGIVPYHEARLAAPTMRITSPTRMRSAAT
jgi:aminocarboxymuconate-semialdehyde decarboxylase